MANKFIKYQIITPKGVVKKGEATYISCQSTTYLLGLLPGHEKMISTVDFSILSINNQETKQHFVVGEGFLEVDDNGDVKLVVNSVENPKEIDIARANESLKRATARLQSNDPNVDKIRASKALKRANIRIKAYQID